MRLFLLLSALLFAPIPVMADTGAPAPAPVADPAADVIPYLEHVVEWNRSIVSAEQLMTKPREAILGDRLRQDTQTTVQRSFDYARAEAALAKLASAGQQDDSAHNTRAELAQRLADVDDQIANLQSQLSQPGLSTLMHEQDTGELKMAVARQSLLQAVVGLRQTENNGTLLDQIDTLSRAALAETPSGQPTSLVATSLQAKSAEPGTGIFGLTKSLVAASEKQGTVDDLLARTKGLDDATHSMIAARRTDLQDVLAQGNALKPNSEQPSDLVAYRKSVDALVTRYKKLATAIMPLGETNAALENVAQSLKAWRRMTVASERHLSHELLIRLIILAGSIAVPLVMSAIAHKGIVRLRDAQKRKQLDLVRRVVLAITLIVVVLLNFLTEFGSLATFAGILTAGLAVGLQTVLVSMVAHSLYFGRYGIHVGDRIRVTDVTGEVIQLGLLRLYMRELKETPDGGFAPTGKIVAFPNSVMFQPAALYKYVED